MGHPAVLEAATINVPDPEQGETVKSFIVLNEAATLTAGEVEEYAREHLAAYKIPRKVEFRRAAEEPGVMKILRRELRDREEEGLRPASVRRARRGSTRRVMKPAGNEEGRAPDDGEPALLLGALQWRSPAALRASGRRPGEAKVR